VERDKDKLSLDDIRRANTYGRYFDTEKSTEKSGEKKSKKKKKYSRDSEQTVKPSDLEESKPVGAYERDNTSETQDSLAAILHKALRESTNKAAKRASEKSADDDDEDEEEAAQVEQKPEAAAKSKKEAKDTGGSDEEADLGTPEIEPDIPEDLEELSDAELQHAAQRILRSRDADLKRELVSSPPASPEEAGVLGGAMLIDALADKLAAGLPIDEAMLEASLQEVAKELDVHHDLAGKILAHESVPEGETDADEFDALLQAAASPDTEDRSVPSAHESGGSVNYQGGTNFSKGHLSGAGGSYLSNALPHKDQWWGHAPESSRRRGPDLLLGGIVGYMVGRRRGRIRTEEQLLPVQKSLEKHVKDLHAKITTQEQKIRSLTSEKVSREGETARQAITDKVRARAEAKLQARVHAKQELRRETSQAKRLPGLSIVGASEVQQPAGETAVRTADQASDRAAYGGTGYEYQRQPSERIARVVLPGLERTATVSLPESHYEKTMQTKEAVHSMPETELLGIAATIEVGGQSIKTLYEQGRLDKQAVREVVAEHAQGGRIDQVLSERLKPLHSSETKERMSQEVGVTSSAGGGGGGAGPSGGGVPVGLGVAGGTQSGTFTQRPVDATTASDAVIAQQAAKDDAPGNHATAWVVAAGIGAGLIAILFLL